ncbi:hypothetical protein DAI22_02g370516 [Oryza sativa Japonica Group]|nr:hypothetical protein DAI22_02g370516 [Oryza sativa Japonica Group]
MLALRDSSVAVIAYGVASSLTKFEDVTRHPRFAAIAHYGLAKFLVVPIVDEITDCLKYSSFMSITKITAWVSVKWLC